MSQACYDVQIVHFRLAPFRYQFSLASRIWLIDLDAVPGLPRGLRWLCRFDAADHLGRPGGSLRADLEQWLRQQGQPPPARVLMLANPRVLGYVFNPLSLFYCLNIDGTLDRVVAEVRNTYGGRHCYLLHPDAAGRASTGKAFYVSPFYPVDGTYRMRLPLPGDRLLVNIRLERPAGESFIAVMAGIRRSDRACLWTALRSPLATRAVMLAIRRHGISLYLKGLRPVSRRLPARPAQPVHR